MPKILVMTDLHLTPGSQKIIGLDPLARLSAGIAHASRMHPDADRLVVMGDLTHYGDTASYAKLRAAFATVPWPVSYLLGNHDIRWKFRRDFPDCPTDPAGFVQSVVDLREVRLITLDTLDEDAEIEHSGHLCQDRLSWLADRLTETDQPCLIFMHHPPFKTGFPGMDTIRLLNDGAFRETVLRGNVAHIFAGHVHRTIHGSVDGIPATIFKSTCHQMPMLLGADDTTVSVDEPGAYGIVLVDGGEIVVHFEDFTLPRQPIGQT